MNNKRPYIIQFVCILTLLIVIMMQGFTHVVKMKPLKGYVNEEIKPVALSFKTYYDGSYQNYLTKNAKDNTGFREFFIRNYNQVAYSCFGKSTNNNIVEGIDHELYLKMYLNDVTGVSLKQYYADTEEAKASALENVEETLRLIDTLQQHGTNFLFVFAPSKTLVYPEKMPKYYRERMADFSLQEYYIELFKEKGIPHIDFLNYFRSIKDTAAYPLYTRTGTHWAQSTIPMVMDSIFRKMEEVTHCKLPSVKVDSLNLTTDYPVMDAELEINMNLLFPFPKPALLILAAIRSLISSLLETATPTSSSTPNLSKPSIIGIIGNIIANYTPHSHISMGKGSRPLMMPTRCSKSRTWCW